MTQPDPLGGLGGLGGLDMNALLQQAQAMQEQMVSAQDQLARTEVEGTVNDGLVTVTVDGTGELLRVQIRANSFDPADTEDLEDLIVAAYRDARARADALAAEAMGPLGGVMDALRGGTSEPADPAGDADRPQLGF